MLSLDKSDSAQNSWICICGKENTENFCGICGRARRDVVNMQVNATDDKSIPNSENHAEIRNTARSQLISSDNANLEFTGLDLYYQKEFQEIYETGETYKGKFNWWPFFFAGIWALYKGLWKSALVWLVASIATGGIAGLACGIYLGFRGNYLYYHKYVYHKEILF